MFWSSETGSSHFDELLLTLDCTFDSCRNDTTLWLTYFLSLVINRRPMSPAPRVNTCTHTQMRHSEPNHNCMIYGSSWKAGTKPNGLAVIFLRPSSICSWIDPCSRGFLNVQFSVPDLIWCSLTTARLRWLRQTDKQTAQQSDITMGLPSLDTACLWPGWARAHGRLDPPGWERLSSYRGYHWGMFPGVPSPVGTQSKRE